MRIRKQIYMGFCIRTNVLAKSVYVFMSACARVSMCVCVCARRRVCVRACACVSAFLCAYMHARVFVSICRDHLFPRSLVTRFSTKYFGGELGFFVEGINKVFGNYSLDQSYWEILDGDLNQIPVGG